MTPHDSGRRPRRGAGSRHNGRGRHPRGRHALDERQDGASAGDLFAAPLVVPREQSGLPLDKFLAITFPELDRGYLRELIRGGFVSVDGQPMTSSRAVWGNAVVLVEPDGEDATLYHEDRSGDLPILFENDELVVIDKPAGLSIHGHTLSELLAEVRVERGETFHTTNRVDREASGIVPVAKTLACARWLQERFTAGRIDAEYAGIVRGAPRADEFEIDLPLGPDERRSGRRVVDREHGEAARTRVRVADRFDGYASVAIFPLTDATHQMRAHLAAFGYPLAVDSMYGDRSSLSLSDLKRHYAPKSGRHEKPILARVALHARSLACELPSGARVRIECPLPEDLTRCLSALDKYRSPGGRNGDVLERGER